MHENSFNLKSSGSGRRLPSYCYIIHAQDAGFPVIVTYYKLRMLASSQLLLHNTCPLAQDAGSLLCYTIHTYCPRYMLLSNWYTINAQDASIPVIVTQYMLRIQDSHYLLHSKYSGCRLLSIYNTTNTQDADFSVFVTQQILRM